jgi:uncharacterized membrane protein YukC
MVNENLINYIKESKKSGFSNDVIEIALLEAGWKKEDIDEGFKLINNKILEQIPKKKNKTFLIIGIIIIVILIGLFAIYQFFI